MNLLSKETSPYLLQHKDNPVHWLPWSESAFAKAKKENKIVLISIGYSACHWCHVMEHECFEDAAVAEIMNQNFVCIKVDREERPDVDKAYMDALQMMNKQGGWPLNCFATPEKKPFFGGTYFPKVGWIDLLKQITKLWIEKPKQVIDFANQVTNGVENSLQIFSGNEYAVSMETLVPAMDLWKSQMDNELGGFSRAPKFPLPNSYEYLINYATQTNDQDIFNHTYLTLIEMCRGGIYDQIGGGFSRYSVDEFWKVPHFEKMLYDNAQLLSLYAKGFQTFGDDEFLETISTTINFLKRDLQDKSGLFYSALDADSEGVEGKYYVWSKKELQEVLTKKDWEKAKFYYNFNAFGEWEGNYIPLRQMSDKAITKEWNTTIGDVKTWVLGIQQHLLSVRNKRIAPGLDNKILCSWNALAVIGLLDVSTALNPYSEIGKESFELAKTTLKQLDHHYFHEDKSTVYRTLRDGNPIAGFLDDYAILCNAFLKMYEATFDEQYLLKSKSLATLILDKFYDTKYQLFHYAPIGSNELFANQTDFVDDAIPSSNSFVAHALRKLSVIFGNSYFEEISERLLLKVSDKILKTPYNFSNWCQLALLSQVQKEIVIVGKDAYKWFEAIKKATNSNDLIVVSTKRSELSIFKNRFQENETRIFVCENKTCGLPITNLETALEMLSNRK